MFVINNYHDSRFESTEFGRDGEPRAVRVNNAFESDIGRYCVKLAGSAGAVSER